MTIFDILIGLLGSFIIIGLLSEQIIKDKEDED